MGDCVEILAEFKVDNILKVDKILQYVADKRGF